MSKSKTKMEWQCSLQLQKIMTIDDRWRSSGNGKTKEIPTPKVSVLEIQSRNNR